jgi:hypothetical protein
MYRPSQTPRQSLSSERIAPDPKPVTYGQKRESFDSLSALPNKKRDDESSGISLVPVGLPLMLHLSCPLSETD